MTPAEQIAVECLGQLDALYEPLRDPRAPYWAPTWYLRWHYSRRGLPYRGTGSKTRERELAEAVSEGFVIRRRGVAKTTALILTRHGLETAWRLTGTSLYSERIVAEAVEAESLDLHGQPGGWVAEIAFTLDHIGWGDGRQDELRRVEWVFRPALVSGVIESNCSMRGNVAYSRTTAALPDAPPDWGELPEPEPDADAGDVHLHAFRETLAWLGAQTPESVGARGELGEVPLIHCTLGAWSAKHAGASTTTTERTN